MSCETLDRKTVRALIDSMPSGDNRSAAEHWLADHPDADQIEVQLSALGRLEAIAD